MKILVVTDLYPPDAIGGYEMGCRQAVEALRERGHDVRVLTSAPRMPVRDDPGVVRSLKLVDAWSHYLYEHTRPIVARLEENESLRISSFNVHALLGEIESFQPDVVYVWMLVGIGGLGLMACLHHLQTPWVWHLMDDVPIMLCSSGRQVMPELLRQVTQQLQGEYISCSQQLVDEIKLLGVDLGTKVSVIPNWVAGPIRPQRRQYLQEGKLRIVTAAGLVHRASDKGMDIVVQAAKILHDSGRTNFSVEIYGRDLDGYFPRWIRDLELEDHVHMGGIISQADLSDRFAEADVFAFPTRKREPFGFVALEAAARGCVPIASQICGYAEWFVHGLHLLKAPRDTSSYSAIFAAILDGDIDLEPIGRRAAEVVTRDFHVNSVICHIEKVLFRAMARRSSTGGARPEEAYRMAVLAERLSRVLIQDSLCA
jgi:glycogen(starch) synthase